MNQNIIITRHPALVEYLWDHFPQLEGCPHVEHATFSDVVGKHVWGILPFHLAVHAKSITQVNLNLPQEVRGFELSYEDIEKYCTGVQRFVIKSVPMEDL